MIECCRNLGGSHRSGDRRREKSGQHTSRDNDGTLVTTELSKPVKRGGSLAVGNNEVNLLSRGWPLMVQLTRSIRSCSAYVWLVHALCGMSRSRVILDIADLDFRTGTFFCVTEILKLSENCRSKFGLLFKSQDQGHEIFSNLVQTRHLNTPCACTSSQPCNVSHNTSVTYLL